MFGKPPKIYTFSFSLRLPIYIRPYFLLEPSECFTRLPVSYISLHIIFNRVFLTISILIQLYSKDMLALVPMFPTIGTSASLLLYIYRIDPASVRIPHFVLKWVPPTWLYIVSVKLFLSPVLPISLLFIHDPLHEESRKQRVLPGFFLSVIVQQFNDYSPKIRCTISCTASRVSGSALKSRALSRA